MIAPNKLYKISCFVKDQRGVAIVEFALAFPLFVIMFMGIIETGFIVREYRRLNDLVDAQVLYLSASNCAYSPTSTACQSTSNGEQFYNTATSSASTITTAVNEVASRIRASDATPVVTLGCGCSTGSGPAAKITLNPKAYKPGVLPFCAIPPDGPTCSEWHMYAYVGATHQYEGFFLDSVITPNMKLSLLPNMQAYAMVRIH